jgi:hypothetical protein
MKKFIVALLCVLFSASVWSWENQDWILDLDWYLEMDDEGEYIYWLETPKGEFRKTVLPAGSAVYHRRIRNEYFSYFYQTEPERIYLLGYDRNLDGKDDELTLSARNGFSLMFIKDNSGDILEGGRRLGGQYLEAHPLVGVWGTAGNPSEIRLAEEGPYVYSLEITKIPGFAIRAGTYLFRQTGDRAFETDSSFLDGHMRLEIRRRDMLVLTPLFTLPGEEGLVEPLFIRSMPKENLR